MRLFRNQLIKLGYALRLVLSAAIEDSGLKTAVEDQSKNLSILQRENADLRREMDLAQRTLLQIEEKATKSWTALEILNQRLNLAATKTDLENKSAKVGVALDVLAEHVNSLSNQHDFIQLGLDALRINQQEILSENTQRAAEIDRILALQLESASLAATHATDIELITQLQRDAKDAACRAASVDPLETRLTEISDLIKDLLSQGANTLQIMTIISSRADLVARRAAIPLGREVLMRIPDGLALVPADDGALVAAVWEASGRLEPGTLAVATSLLREGDCVVDVGANIGLLAIPMARRIGPTGHLIAVEPSEQISGLLQRSVFLNFGQGRVTVHRCAVGATSGTAMLNLGATAGHSSLLPLASSVRSEGVTVCRLDELIMAETRVRLVKIDVEGLEPEVWRGMTRILAENPDLTVIVEFGPEHLRRAGLTIDAWLETFISGGFSAYEIDETDGTLSYLRGREALAKVISINLLLLRRPLSAYPGLALK